MKKLIIFCIFMVALAGSNYPVKAEAITAGHSFLSHLSNIAKMENQEIWKDIKGFENSYQISNLGRVKSVERIINWHGSKHPVKERILKNINNGNGYLKVTLEEKRYYLHRLIAFSFIPNPENKPCINHKNGIRNDNRIENLEWCTHSENSIHSFVELNHIPNGKGCFGILNKTSKKVYQYNKNGNLISKYDAVNDAFRITGISADSISNCARGVSKSAGGFIWKYESYV